MILFLRRGSSITPSVRVKCLKLSFSPKWLARVTPNFTTFFICRLFESCSESFLSSAVVGCCKPSWVFPVVSRNACQRCSLASRDYVKRGGCMTGMLDRMSSHDWSSKIGCQANVYRDAGEYGFSYIPILTRVVAGTQRPSCFAQRQQPHSSPKTSASSINTTAFHTGIKADILVSALSSVEDPCRVRLHP